MPEETLCHTVDYFNPVPAGRKRSRCCPRERWSGSPHPFLSKAKIKPEDAPAAAQDRVYWRTIVSALSTLALCQQDN